MITFAILQYYIMNKWNCTVYNKTTVFHWCNDYFSRVLHLSAHPTRYLLILKSFLGRARYAISALSISHDIYEIINVTGRRTRCKTSDAIYFRLFVLHPHLYCGNAMSFTVEREETRHRQNRISRRAGNYLHQIRADTRGDSQTEFHLSLYRAIPAPAHTITSTYRRQKKTLCSCFLQALYAFSTEWSVWYSLAEKACHYNGAE